MLKRRTPKEVIESALDSKRERTFIKYSREEPVDVTSFLRGEDYVVKNLKYFYERFKHRNHPYIDIHTHLENDSETSGSYFPSPRDINHFLEFRKIKMMVIAVKRPDSGKFLGYYVLKRTDKTPKKIKEFFTGGTNSDAFYESLKKDYHLQSRVLPVKGYTAVRGHFQKIQKPNLEKIVKVASFLVFFFGLFFLSSNITGNIIVNLSQNSTNFLGAVLFMAGIVGIYFCFRKRNN